MQIQWLKCLRDQWGVDSDYIGIWNERPQGSVDYVVSLRRELDKANFSHVGITVETTFVALNFRDGTHCLSRAPLSLAYTHPPDVFVCLQMSMMCQLAAVNQQCLDKRDVQCVHSRSNKTLYAFFGSSKKSRCFSAPSQKPMLYLNLPSMIFNTDPCNETCTSAVEAGKKIWVGSSMRACVCAFVCGMYLNARSSCRTY